MVVTEKKYKMVASDLDGTLLDKNKQISNRNVKVIQELASRGVHVCLITGRMTGCVLDYEKRLGLDMHLVCHNGASGCGPKEDGRPLFFHRPVPKETANMIIDFVNKHDLVLNFYSRDGKLYARCKNEEQMNLTKRYTKLTNAQFTYVSSYEELRNIEPFKLLVLTSNVQPMYETIQKTLVEHKQKAHLIRGDFFVEVLNPQANKEYALNELCKKIGIKIEEVVALGDGENDKEFLSAAGYGICMKNGHDISKKIAKKVSPYTNNEDAVARELEMLIDSNSFAYKTDKPYIPTGRTFLYVFLTASIFSLIFFGVKPFM